MSLEISAHISQLDAFSNLADTRVSTSSVFGIPPITKGTAFGQSTCLEVVGKRVPSHSARMVWLSLVSWTSSSVMTLANTREIEKSL